MMKKVKYLSAVKIFQISQLRSFRLRQDNYPLILDMTLRNRLPVPPAPRAIRRRLFVRIVQYREYLFFHFGSALTLGVESSFALLTGYACGGGQGTQFITGRREPSEYQGNLEAYSLQSILRNTTGTELNLW